MAHTVHRTTRSRMSLHLLGTVVAAPLLLAAAPAWGDQGTSEGAATNAQKTSEECTYQVEYYSSGKVKSRVGFMTNAQGMQVLGCMTTVYYENGNVAMEQAFRDGLPHGVYRTYYENGTREMEYEYEYGTPDGPVTYWYPSGRMKAQGTMKEGVKDGRWTTWHEDGTVESEGEYANGRKVGVWTYRKADGVTTKVVDYTEASKAE